MTLAEYEKAYYPGAKVTITLPGGTILIGRAGNLWGSDGKTMAVQLEDGGIVKVTETLAKYIEVEKAN